MPSRAATDPATRIHPRAADLDRAPGVCRGVPCLALTRRHGVDLSSDREAAEWRRSPGGRRDRPARRLDLDALLAEASV